MANRKVLHALRDRIEGQIVGQTRMVEHLLIALLADGHVLLEGAPGLAKTRMAHLVATAFDAVFRRIQFTSDLMPSDITGSAIYDQGGSRFVFQKGPLFANFVLADEINRAPSKVQSALLEAMEERQISSGDKTYPLEQPFFVIATQNPIEHDGTWDLPRAQLDRFLLHIVVEFPKADDERAILELMLSEAREAGQTDIGKTDGAPIKLISPQELAAARSEVLNIHISPLIIDYITRIISGTRDDPEPIDGVGEHLDHPISPRGSIALARTAQARAWLHERDYVLPDDVIALAPDALRHRIGLRYRSEMDGIRPDDIVESLLASVE